VAQALPSAADHLPSQQFRDGGSTCLSVAAIWRRGSSPCPNGGAAQKRWRSP